MIDWYRLLPRYWFQIKPTCLLWDEALNAALDKHPLTDVDGYVCSVGPLRVWIGNYPYAYGSDWGSRDEWLPKVATRKRLKNAVNAVRHEQRLDAHQKLMERLK